MSTAAACDACLRRTWLIARLAGRIEIARRERRSLRALLALDDEALLAALADEATRAAYEVLDVGELRGVARDAGVDALCRHDRGYPLRLLALVDAPAALFVAGGVARLARLVGGDLEQGPRVAAIVGMRKASPDGLDVARTLGRGLAAAGVTVVSGMALGVDSAAHAGALEVDGPTVAVLAGAPEVPYPRRKAALHREIVERACVVSELPPGFTPLRWCFPARNRVIAGLAQVTIVVEAAERSGALITAEVAADLGREVGAVPGPVASARSDGTNALLRDGATVIRGPRDALDSVVGVEVEAGDEVAPLPAPLAATLDEVAAGRDTLAALVRTPEAAGAMLAALGELELLGRVRRTVGGRYVVVAR